MIKHPSPLEYVLFSMPNCICVCDLFRDNTKGRQGSRGSDNVHSVYWMEKLFSPRRTDS